MGIQMEGVDTGDCIGVEIYPPNRTSDDLVNLGFLIKLSSGKKEAGLLFYTVTNILKYFKF